MSDPQSIGESLKGRQFPTKPNLENGITNPGKGPYALPTLHPKTPEQRLAFQVAGDFDLWDHIKFLLKWIHHFKCGPFINMVGKVKERSDVRDKGKYLCGIIKEELAEEELAKKEKDGDNISK